MIKIHLNWLIISFFACISYKFKFSFRPPLRMVNLTYLIFYFTRSVEGGSEGLILQNLTLVYTFVVKI